MKKVIDYKIVTEKEVVKDLNNGWQPLGSPYAIFYEGREVHCQAMVKYESWPPE